MPITLKRTIWPVGHGAFYTEQWKDSVKDFFNVVYDCGSGMYTQTPPDSDLAKCIGYYSKTVGDIDALFISHFHHDHINGVDMLLNSKNVKAIYLPQLTPNRIVEALLFERINGNDDSALESSVELFKQLEKHTWNKVPVFEILEGEDIENIRVGEVITESSNENSENGIRVSIIRNKNNHLCLLPEDLRKVKSKEVLSQYCWIYKPYNVKKEFSFKDTKIGDFIHDNKLNVDELVAYIKEKNIDEIKTIYDYLFDQGNDYSMPVYSGFCEPYLMPCVCECLDESHNVIRIHHYCFPFGFPFSTCNCLYMGDFESKKGDAEQLINYYEHQWSVVGLLQVPHHGSKDNYHDALYEVKKTCFVSCSRNDMNLKSHSDVIDSIKAKKCDICFVTDDPLSKLEYYYRFV